MLLGELAVFIAGGFGFMGMLHVGNLIVKRPGPCALPPSAPSTSPEVA
jgi:hypothetical protein